MELHWNLKSLFNDIEECYRTFDEIDRIIESIENYKGATLTSDSLLSILDEYFEIKELAYRALVYGSLRYYQNVSSEECIELKASVERKNNEVSKVLSFVDDMILHEGLDSISSLIEDNPELEKYRLYIDNLFRKKRHIVNSDEITTLKNEIDALLKEYNELLKSMTFENITIDGEEIELNSSNSAKYLVSRDRPTRAAAYKSINKAYDEKKEEFARILNSLYQKRVELSRLEGYNGVLEKSLDTENIDSKIIEELIRVVNENKRLLNDYMMQKAAYLSLESPHLFDLGVPLDKDTKRKFPLELGLEIIKNSYKPLGAKYNSSIDELLKTGHIDATPNDDKHQSITFSWWSYSFLNYREAYYDLKNLTHELGHSINDFLSSSQPFPYRISTNFVGETASIVNEILLVRSLLESAETDEEKLFYLSKEIDNYITSVFRQTMYTELELILYEKVSKGGELTSEFLSDTYFELVKSYYGEGIKYDDETKVEWTRLGHLYRWSFYPYSYATGLLIASTVYMKLLDGTLRTEEYIKFLSSGSNAYSLDLLKILGIDMKDLSILGRGFEVLESDLDELKVLMNKTDFQI